MSKWTPMCGLARLVAGGIAVTALAPSTHAQWTVVNLHPAGATETEFVLGDPAADCNADGQVTIADFGCFQTQFVLGCP